jgi:hypothetical protein
MDPGNTETDITVMMPPSTQPPSALGEANRLKANSYLKKCNLPLMGGSVQQAFIHACCAQQINA